MDIDDFYVKTNNQFGRTQKLWVGLVCMLVFYAPFQTFQVVFTGHVPMFACVTGNGTFNSSACGSVITNDTSLPCILDREPDAHADSFVKEWASAAPCESDLALRANLAHMLGITVGALFLGHAADCFGRKPVLLVSMLGAIAFGAVGSCLAPTFAFFAASRFSAGVGVSGILICSFVLISEIVGPSARGFCGTLFQAVASVGVMAFAGLAYLMQTDWRMLSLVSSLFGLPLLAVAAFMPESARWLYVNGRDEEGWKTLRMLTRRSSSKEDVKIKVNSAAEGGWGQAMDMLRLKPGMVSILAFSWFVSSAVYQVLGLSTGLLGDNLYTSIVFHGLSELPALLFSGILVDRIGRRLPLAVFMMLGGLSCMACQVVDPIDWSVSSSVARFGIACITAGSTIVNIHSTELLPTVVRNTGFGLFISMARVGTMVASSSYFVGSNTFWECVGLGGLAVFSGYLSLSLPETLNKKLPENLEDLEKWKEGDGLRGCNNDPPCNCPKMAS